MKYKVAKQERKSMKPNTLLNPINDCQLFSWTDQRINKKKKIQKRSHI